MQNMPPEDSQNQTVFTPPPSLSGAQQPVQKENQGASDKNQSLFYTIEDDSDLQLPQIDEQDKNNQTELNDPFVVPFQNSAAMQTLATSQGSGSAGTPLPATHATTKVRVPFHILRVLLIGSVVFITIIGASLFVFAQSTTSSNTTPASNTHKTETPGTPLATMKPTQKMMTKTATPTKQSSNTPTQQGQGEQNTTTPSAETLPSPQQLTQLGWTQAGLTLGDALEALRTGSTFTDREMSYDYRNIGTPTNHSGTLAGSVFLLTPGGKSRFFHNDVRMINNNLYDKIQENRIIQQVVDTQPSLAQFQVLQIQGQQHLFAWINVAFELLLSKRDPGSGNRTESIESNGTTGQPLLYHMTVLLLRVPPQDQGDNAPMGGTGWLVNTYVLNSATLPTLETTPSL